MCVESNYKIPKVIHYVWFGKNPKSRTVRKCIASWKKYCPDYKIIEWNESNYNVKKNRYMYEAYKAKKWAFASDYARFDIIYHCGGIYLDTDVELISGIDEFRKDDMFIGFLEERRVASGLGFGSTAGNPIIKEILEYYRGRSFYKPNGVMDLRVCNHNETKVLVKHGLIRNGQEQWLDYGHVYPREILNPMNGIPTAKTVAINHFSGSWSSLARRVKDKRFLFVRKYLDREYGDYIINMTNPILDLLESLEQHICKVFSDD